MVSLAMVLIWLAFGRGVLPGANASKAGKTDLYIGGIFPMTGGGWSGGQACLPAALMALHDVNHREDILPGYHLNMIHNDSECNPGIGTNVMYRLVYHPPPKLMLLTGCSSVSTHIAEAAHMWNLMVLAYGSSSPALSDRKRFRTFFRTHPSAVLHNQARIRMFQYYQWSKISIIQETQEVFTSTIEDLEKRAKEANITIATRQSFLSDPTNAVRSLKRQDARIIVGVFYEDMALKVFCQVYKEKMYGKRYVWFIIGWYPDNWYQKVEENEVNCTVNQMREALQGHFTTEMTMRSLDDTPSFSGLNVSRFDEELLLKLNNSDPNDTPGYPEAPLAYDAVWALALALNQTITRLKEKGVNVGLDKFTYDNSTIFREFYRAMDSTSFQGVSGPVQFLSTGDRLTLTQIEQMWNGRYYKIGYYDNKNNNWTLNHSFVRWNGPHPPYDRTLVVEDLRLVSMELYVGMCSSALIAMLAAFGCLVFNVLNRNVRYITMSQPGLNNITVLGCVTCLSCIFLFGLDSSSLSEEQFTAVCQVRTWVLVVGFTLAVGSMFSKIWRVHRLTTREREEDKIVEAWKLYALLGLFLAVDVIIMTVWQFTNPMTRYLEEFPQEVPEGNDDILIQPKLEHCTCDNFTIWLGVLYGYKGLLLLFGVFLAYETRDVNIKDINDTRYVGMSIYNIVVLCLITAPVTILISSQQDATFAFTSLAILFCTVITLGLIFVPKMMNYKQKSIEETSQPLQTPAVTQEEEEKQKRLQEENDTMKKQITQKEERIRELQKSLKELLKEGQKMTTSFLAPPGVGRLRTTGNNFGRLSSSSMASSSAVSSYASNATEVFEEVLDTPPPKCRGKAPSISFDVGNETIERVPDHVMLPTVKVTLSDEPAEDGGQFESFL
ncbi:GABBR1 [Branchiostoma lanceolatum]|uniref:GABBR1 protein n=1 Tax=Branchiostoma lanceolatum TaxID=7740 RepID=A0A8K0ABS6_BRALA|nr:GABBR1 [Branchiostoma lanceolatum]